MIDERDKQIILDRTNIEDVVEDFMPSALIRKGSRLFCNCPLHSDKTPSFVVTPSLNIFKCFSCGVGGDAIAFLMDVQKMTYPEAMRYLAKRANYTLTEKDDSRTAEELAAIKKREAMLAINKAAADFYAGQLKKNDDKSRQAREYAHKRWPKDFCEQEKIGFAPGRNVFRDWAKAKGFSTDILLEVGLLKKNDRGEIYDFYRDRITIPIYSRTGQVLGFTARTLLKEDNCKYLNSPESEVFHKGEIIFGLRNAIRIGAKEELFYLVEGAPDALKLQSIGIVNTIAALGTAWTDKHFEQLRRFNPTLCFIPDIDPPKPGEPYGTGIATVMKLGLKALEQGFNVIVKEIEPGDKTMKADPDSFIKSKAVLNEIPKEDFIPWYASKRLIGKETAVERAEVFKPVVSLLADVRDQNLKKILIKRLSKLFVCPESMINSAINEAINGNVRRKSSTGEKMIDQELYQKYGFSERHHCYFSLDKDAQQVEWSNFTMEPLFHIKDAVNPKRLYRIINVNNQEEIIELKQEDLVSLQRFKLRVEGFGNFIWKAKDEQLTKLKGFLYEKTETAVEITQLGWQRDEFFAFGNGVSWHGQWIPVDDFGIVRLPDIGNFYLPAASKIYRNERKLFQFERKFVHAGLNDISFRKYTDKLIEVFGDNAKVGICFLLATLFKDIVTGVTKNFPILNLFGPKGSGKSELGHSLMAFFIQSNDPPNLSSATDAALADAVAQCANALVHLDEYKNTIELIRREFLKGLYDGVGRTRMNMDRDKKRETTAVDCGIILSGQEMPTVDIAIFSRLLFLTFNKSEFSTEAKRKFDELKAIRDLGCSHLVLEILRHRKRVEADFSSNYKAAMADILASIEGESVEDRIFRNWIIPLAIFRTLAGVIDVGFDYKEMLKICVNGILRQNKECRSTNEIASFWNVVDFLHQNGDIFIEADYRIKYENRFKGKGMKDSIIFPRAKPVLYLLVKRIFPLYKKNGKSMGDSTLPTESLRFYLENSKEYIGTKNAVKFKNLSNPVDSNATTTNSFGQVTVLKTSHTDWALCFDYEMIAENYGINLEVETSHEDDIDPLDVDENDKSLPF